MKPGAAHFSFVVEHSAYQPNVGLALSWAVGPGDDMLGWARLGSRDAGSPTPESYQADPAERNVARPTSSTLSHICHAWYESP